MLLKSEYLCSDSLTRHLQMFGITERKGWFDFVLGSDEEREANKEHVRVLMKTLPALQEFLRAFLPQDRQPLISDIYLSSDEGTTALRQLIFSNVHNASDLRGFFGLFSEQCRLPLITLIYLSKEIDQTTTLRQLILPQEGRWDGSEYFLAILPVEQRMSLFDTLNLANDGMNANHVRFLEYDELGAEYQIPQILPSHILPSQLQISAHIMKSKIQAKAKCEMYYHSLFSAFFPPPPAPISEWDVRLDPHPPRGKKIEMAIIGPENSAPSTTTP